MPDDNDREYTKLSRRQFAEALGAGGLGLGAGGAQGQQANGDPAAAGVPIAQLQGDVPVRNVLVGPDSAVPADADGNEGDVYLAEDGPTYTHDGSTWNIADVGSSSNPVPSSHFQSLTTEDLDINNEALVEAEKTADQSYSSANGWVNITWDDEKSDITDDFDLANNELSPSEDGYYQICLQARAKDFADQDRILVRVRNTTDGETVFDADETTSGTQIDTVGGTIETELLASKTYVAQFRNINSDDTISGDDTATFWTISRSEEA